MTPQVFGDYLLTSRLVERSMAEVFLAVRLGDRAGRLVVIKRAPLDESASGAVAESIRREIEVLSSGPYAGVVRMVDHGEIAGLPFVALEHVKGRSLDEVLGGGGLSAEAAMLLGRDVARGLASLHERGWVHGDVTPSNVIVDDTGEATLVDLGIARKVGEPREMPAGKPGYASPEAAVGKPATPSDDVYAWGIVVSECLIGARLFREADLAEAAARRSSLPLPVEEAPLLAAALSLDPSARPPASALVAGITASSDARRVLADAALSAELRAGEREPALSPEPGPAVTASDPAIVRMVQASSVRPPARAATPRVLLLIASLVAAGALLLGFFVGRRTAPREHGATISLPQLPARAEVKLDGRTLLNASGARRVPIDPGSHKLSVQLGRKESREYEFVAQPGEHVVLVIVPNARANRDGGD